MAAAVISLLIWTLVGRYAHNESWSRSVTDGVKHFIAVMAVACPCTLVLTVSSVGSTGLALGIISKVVFRSLSALLNDSRIEAFAFDKTGTLSEGILSVVQAIHTEPLVAELARELASSNRHPISVAVKRYIEEIQGAQTCQLLLSGIEVIPGRGLLAEYYGYPILAGKAEFTVTVKHSMVQGLMKAGQSVFLITFGNRLIGIYGLVDYPRKGASRLIESRRPRPTFVLSGDHAVSVSRFATSLGMIAVGGLSPNGKADEIRRLIKTYGKTAFVGDGTNDALALSQASLSIAVGSGSEIAAATSSIVLLTSDVPTGVQEFLDIAAATRAHLFVGFAWCTIYFTFAILLAAGVAVDFTIPPEWAGLGEVVSIVPVLLTCVSLWTWRAWGGYHGYRSKVVKTPHA